MLEKPLIESLRELPSHFGRCRSSPQHLDLGHNFLFVKFVGEGEFIGPALDVR